MNEKELISEHDENGKKISYVLSDFGNHLGIDAMLNGESVGHIHFRKNHLGNPKNIYVSILTVDSEYREKNIGQNLLNAMQYYAIEKNKNIYLLPGNLAGNINSLSTKELREFYKKRGFEPLNKKEVQEHIIQQVRHFPLTNMRYLQGYEDKELLELWEKEKHFSEVNKSEKEAIMKAINSHMVFKPSFKLSDFKDPKTKEWFRKLKKTRV